MFTKRGRAANKMKHDIQAGDIDREECCECQGSGETECNYCCGDRSFETMTGDGCPVCGGDGKMVCPNCDGSGVEP